MTPHTATFQHRVLRTVVLKYELDVLLVATIAGRQYNWVPQGDVVAPFMTYAQYTVPE